MSSSSGLTSHLKQQHRANKAAPKEDDEEDEEEEEEEDEDEDEEEEEEEEEGDEEEIAKLERELEELQQQEAMLAKQLSMRDSYEEESSEEEDTIFDPLEHVVYNDELFISKPDQMYECSICLNTLRDATICTSCGNSFCHKCIVDCIERLRKCSVCGCVLKSTTEGIVPNRITRGVIENYEVKCFSTQKAHQSGVGAFYGTFAVGLPSPIKADSKGKKDGGVPSAPAPPAASRSISSKPKVDVPSSSLPAEMCTEMCDWTGLLRDAESHYRIHCPFALVHCAHKRCSYISTRRKVHMHCQHKGCKFVSAPNDASAHLSQCAFRTSHCQWCKKDLVFHSALSHEYFCEDRVVECPNGCCDESSEEQGQVVYRLVSRDVKKHRLVCKKEVVACGYASAGCDVRLTRDEMPAHEQDAAAHMLLLFRELKLARTEIVQLEAKTKMLEEKVEVLQRDRNNVSVTMIPLYSLREPIFQVDFAPVVLGNHEFNMVLGSSGGSGMKASFWDTFHRNRICPMLPHKLHAQITCRRRCQGSRGSFGSWLNMEVKGYLICSISVPDQPSIPMKSKKWESFVIPPYADKKSNSEQCCYSYSDLSWPAASIREIITSPELVQCFSPHDSPLNKIMFKLEWHLE